MYASVTFIATSSEQGWLSKLVPVADDTNTEFAEIPVQRTTAR